MIVRLFDGPQIAFTLKRLRAALIDAEWQGDAAEVEGLRAEIARLEMLASYGETHDLPF